jgi:hypothetical protein
MPTPFVITANGTSGYASPSGYSGYSGVSIVGNTSYSVTTDVVSANSVTVNWSAGPTHFIQLSANLNLLNFTNGYDGQNYTLVINNPGNYIVSWPSASGTSPITWQSGITPTQSVYQTATQADIYYLKNVKGVYYGTAYQTGPVLNDWYYPYNTLLLHGDNTVTVANSAQNSIILDSSSNNYTITRTGSVTQGTFSPFTAANWSMFVNKSQGAMYLAANSQTAFQSNNFTIEAWLYFTDSTNNQVQTIYSNYTSFGSNGMFFGKHTNQSGQVCLFIGNVSTGGAVMSDPMLPPNNAWVHYAIVRNGSQFTLYRNGTAVAQYSYSGSVTGATNPCYIGAAGDSVSTNNFVGYISNFRIVNGTAVYQNNFIPPAQPLTAVASTALLTCQNNTYKDNSTFNAAITYTGSNPPPVFTPFNPFAPTLPYQPGALGGSLWFDGSTGYLTTTGSLTNAGTGDFSVEAWVYYTGSYGNYNFVFDSRTSAGSYTDGFNIAINNSNGYWYWGQTVQDLLTTTPCPRYSWVHICATRQSGTVRLFQNGILIGSLSNTANLTSTTNIIGSYYGTTGNPYYFPGYISNLRIIKGTGNVPAAYQTSSTTNGTAIFTPPLSPVTAISGTTLLLNGTNAAIFDSTGKNNIITNGNVQLSNSTYKYGTGSIKFNGSPDRLILPAVSTASMPYPTEQLWVGNWTIECWIYPTTINSTFMTIVSTRSSNSDSTAGNFSIGINTSGILWFYASGSTVWAAGTAITANNWYHIAIVRSNGVITGYINGVNPTTSTNNTTGTPASYNVYMYASQMTVGDNAGGTEAFYGYIDDLRITNGIARYTTNFTPPSLIPDI